LRVLPSLVCAQCFVAGKFEDNMAFCGSCGSSIPEGVAFCPKCGAPVGTTGAVPPPPPPTDWAPAPGVTPLAATSGLQENVAGMLCYVLGWITGLIFLLIDKRPFVRFHAAQSIVVFGALNLLRIVLVFGLFGGHYYGLFSFWTLISMLLSLVTLVAWLVLMILAYQGKRFEVPVAADIAKNIASR
jgi:uncharacterized membrane protein